MLIFKGLKSLTEEDFMKILPSKAASQIRCALCLRNGPLSLKELTEKEGCSASAVKALCEKGIAEVYDESERRNPFSEKNVIMLHGHALDMRSVTDCNRL